MHPPIPISGVQLAVRAGFAAGLSLVLAQLLALDYPLYALVAAVIVTDLSPAQTRKLGRQRMAASVVGAFCGAVITVVLPPSPWAVALSITAAMLACVLVRVREGAKVAGYVCGIIVLAHGADRWSYAFYRLMETALGIATAWCTSLVPKLLRDYEAKQE
jgi:uncharacterized membrane protein YgaE (UPF0421/DUF939 family)